MLEPRDPSLHVVREKYFFFAETAVTGNKQEQGPLRIELRSKTTGFATNKLRRTNRRKYMKFKIANNERVNDPSAGSPTETLLRLLLPLSVRVCRIFQSRRREPVPSSVQTTHQDTQSVAATGGVYKGQGRNRCKLMICTY